MINFSLEGKIALITGASRGIGKAIAMALSDHGAHCVLASRKIEGLQEVVGEIEEKGKNASAIACNTGYLEQIDSLFKTYIAGATEKVTSWIAVNACGVPAS